MTGADGADGAGEDVVENESGDGKAGKEWSHGIPNHYINAAPHIHAAAFHVHGPNGEAEQHDGKDEPGSALADCTLGDATDIKRGRCHVAEDDCGAMPERDE